MDVNQTGASVCDDIQDERNGKAGADGIARRIELPKAVDGGDGSIGEDARVFVLVDEAKVVRAGSIVFEAGGEDFCGQGAEEIGEESGAGG